MEGINISSSTKSIQLVVITYVITSSEVERNILSFSQVHVPTVGVLGRGNSC